LSQLFSPGINNLARLFVLALVIGAVAALIVVSFVADTSYSTGVNIEVQQPLQFSHKHHVQGLGLDCRFCHFTAERSSSAGFPDTQTCMGCHATVWSQAEILKSVRASWAHNQSLEWIRVHNLPDHVYFDHSVHVAKGISCTTCHGDVEHMTSIVQKHDFRMKDCVKCHEQSDPQLKLRNCTICHR